MVILSKQRLGIDLGTSTTLIYIQDKGIALREPSLIAIKKESKEIVAFGKEAEMLLGRSPEEIEVIHPIREGVIANFTHAKQMLAHFIRQALHRTNIHPEVVIGVPTYISKVERKALIDTVKDIGIRKALIVDQPYAAAVGLGLAIKAPRGQMILDIGGGTTDVALLSLNEIIHSKTSSFAGQAFNQSIQDYFYHQHQMLLSTEMAETLKKKIGQAQFKAGDINDSMLAKGRSTLTDLACEQSVTSEQIHQAIIPIVNQIVQTTREVFEMASPELVVDVLENGLYLTGGGSLLKGLSERLAEELKVPVHQVENPIDCVVLGAGKLLKQLDNQAKRTEIERR